MLKRLREKPFVLLVSYVAVLFFAALVPLWAKRLFTGNVGPNSIFTALAIIAPLAFMLLGLIQSLRISAIHLACLAAIGLWTFLSYPSPPPMNFMRQFPMELGPNLLPLFILGAAGNLLIGEKRT